ncbi:hypothetical protein Runsl_2708 [Runella slithyformis DSM 19594]|uniref:Uncharacterized protein n=1 Tax=Runella slithyformis (strain ATCC 29530 / DSM 19594 / LMG 11500 / NCIMB 11436 / LSU 4) TaxID=761193 RepID=A0A7U4E604_RUNSL|nr:hypothetical protein Runsl_2708 [Runella slithyformis DSM 19594]
MPTRSPAQSAYLSLTIKPLLIFTLMIFTETFHPTETFYLFSAYCYLNTKSPTISF